MTLVDTNVVLDIVAGDTVWAGWSTSALDAAASRGPLLINDVIHAELSVGYEAIDDLETFLKGTGLRVAPIPREALSRPARHLPGIARQAQRAPACCRTSSSAPMRPRKA